MMTANDALIKIVIEHWGNQPYIVVEHFTYVPDMSSAVSLQSALTQAGHQTHIRHTKYNDQPCFLVLSMNRVVPNKAALEDEMDATKSLAVRHGIYDGQEYGEVGIPSQYHDWDEAVH
jgi:hypothetical protein